MWCGDEDGALLAERNFEHLRTSPGFLRWGLLLSSVAMSAVLVATGLWVSLGVGQAASTVTQGQAIGIAFSGRRIMRTAGAIDGRVLEEVLEGLAPQGLRYVEVVGPDKAVVAKAGELSARRWRDQHHLSPGVTIAIGEDGASARIMTHAFEAGMAGPNRRAGMEVAAGEAGQHPLQGKQVLFEMESTAASALRRRAAVTVVVSFLGALALLGLFMVFLRISRHAEKASLQLEHDRQLKMLGQMSAVLGHEIKNPLASLKGHVQLLLEKLPSDHAGRKGAEVVLRETIRIEELSRQVLEFARTGTVERQSTDPAALVRAAVEVAGGGVVQLNLGGAPATWSLDGARIEEVVVNLLRNARDASTPEQAIDVMVEVDPDGKLHIEVRDHGQGILPGEEERVFEPFYTRRVKGTGLGLALARRIVEGHGGTITAHNHPDGGAVFSVTIPPQTQGD